MEKAILGVILLGAVVLLVRMVVRTLRAAADGSKPAACAGCPFDSECKMQGRAHASECEGEPDES